MADEISSDDLDDLDIESLLARVERKPLTFSRKTCLNQAPEFSQRLTGLDTVNEGNDAMLECRVLAFPRPDLTWYKDCDLILPDHPRITVEEHEGGKYFLKIKNASKGDEAGYKCKAENCEGTTASTFFLFVNAKPKRRQRTKAKRRRVSYPPMFATIVEKVEEEEKAAKEARYAPPSPLSDLYVGITLKSRHTWPKFLGDWAFAEDAIRSCSDCTSEEGDDFTEGCFIQGPEHDDVFQRDSKEHPLNSFLKKATNQFYLGEIEDNEEITISRTGYDTIKRNIVKPVTHQGQITTSNVQEQNNNLTNKQITKPNNLSLTPKTPCLVNSSISAPELASKCQLHVPNRSALSKQHERYNTSTNKNIGILAHDSKDKGQKSVIIHYRECVLVLIVFTFLSLCFGMSCGRFVITVLGLHVIYAVSKSLLEK